MDNSKKICIFQSFFFFSCFVFLRFKKKRMLSLDSSSLLPPKNLAKTHFIKE